MPEILFALAPGQNHFFVEIVEALRGELAALGVPTRVAAEPPPGPAPRVPTWDDVAARLERLYASLVT